VPKSRAVEWKSFNKIFAGKGPSKKWMAAYDEAMSTVNLSRKDRYKTWAVAYRLTPSGKVRPAGGGGATNSPAKMPVGRPKGSRSTPKATNRRSLLKGVMAPSSTSAALRARKITRRKLKVGPRRALTRVDADAVLDAADLPSSGWSLQSATDGIIERYSAPDDGGHFPSAYDVAEHLFISAATVVPSALDTSNNSVGRVRRRSSLAGSPSADGDEETGWLIQSLASCRRTTTLVDAGARSAAGPLDGDVRYFVDDTLPKDWLIRQGPGAPSYMLWPRGGRAPLPQESAPLFGCRRELADHLTGGNHPANLLEHFASRLAAKCDAKRKEQLARTDEPIDPEEDSDELEVANGVDHDSPDQEGLQQYLTINVNKTTPEVS